MKTLQEILGAENLIGLINSKIGGVPDDMIPDAFMRPTRNFSGDIATWLQADTTRKVARQVHYGSPSKKVNDIPGISERTSKAIHSFENIDHEMSVLMNLKSTDGNGARQRLGMQEIARQTTEFKRRGTNLRTAAVTSALANAKINFDSAGNLLSPTASGALTVDFGTPAGNRDQLNVDGSGDIIDVAWSLVGTPIHTQIAQLRKAARHLTGYPIRHAFYGENIPDFLFNNTVLKEFINRSERLRDAASEGEIASPFLRLQWHAMNESFFEDKDGNIVEMFGVDTVVFTPEPSPDWWEMQQGSFPVPNDLGAVSSDALAAVANVTEAFGMFSYAKIKTDPTTIEQFAGDTFLPMIKVPKAIFIADVTP